MVAQHDGVSRLARHPRLFLISAHIFLIVSLLAPVRWRSTAIVSSGYFAISSRACWQRASIASFVIER
jgi:hypothetical protein